MVEKKEESTTRMSFKFLCFLKNRLESLESRKTSVVEEGFLKKGFTKRYNERLYDKTKKIIESLQT